MSPTPPLDRTILQMMDFRDQPMTSHLVFPPSGDRTPIAIDSWKVRDYVFLGYVRGVLEPVIALAADANWIVYSRRLVRMLRTEEGMREGISRGLEMRKVEKELLGSENQNPDPVVMMLDAEPSALGAVPKETSPGQYL